FTNNSTITVASGRTLTFTGGSVDLDQGTVSGLGTLSVAGTATYAFTTSAVTTPMLVAQTVTIPANVAVPSGQTLTLLDGSVIDEPITNQGTILIQGSVTFLGALSMPTGSLLRVGGLAGNSQLFLQDGFTNQGTIELTNVGLAYEARLAVVNGSLVNQGVVSSLPGGGNGGARFLSLALVNDGTLTLDHPLTIDGAFTTHVNNATINVTTDDLTILQSDEGSFTNNGTINIASGRTMTVSGGTLDLDQGTVSGAGTLSVAFATLEFNSTTVTTPMLLFPTVTIPADVTVSSGETLTLLGGTTIDEDVSNSGTIVTVGTVTFNGQLFTDGTIRVGGLAGNSALTVANAFANDGVIQLTNVGLAYSSQLTVTNGPLENRGTIDILPGGGNGGARTLAAALDNQADLNVNLSLAVTGAIDQQSGGDITVAATRTLTVGGLLTLGSGSSTTVNGSIVLNGGCSNQGGSFSGFVCP
ncbi:MAG: hypothetical protein AB7T31_05015, partial [Gemmatimonadales bacterium]